MGQTSKTLLTALIISLFSLSAIQGIKIVTNNNSPKVLGETITNPIAQGVPCATINTWQQRYCSNVVPTIPVTTSVPQPTSTPAPRCNPSATYYSGVTCNNSTEKMLSSAKYLCQDRVNYVQVGDPSGVNCYTQDNLYLQALSRCSGYCKNPQPTPPPRVVTATPTYSYPTPTPNISGNGAFNLKLSNPITELTCKVGDTGCNFSTVVIGTNRTDKTFYYTSLWTTGSNISYTYNGTTITDNKVSTSSIVISPGQEAFNSLVRVTPPKTLGTYYSYFYADGKVCNIGTTPLNCTYYGGSSFYVKINVVN